MDPRAKQLRALKKQGQAVNLIKKGAQMQNWSVFPVADGDAYIIGSKEMVAVMAELLRQQILTQQAQRQAASSELTNG